MRQGGALKSSVCLFALAIAFVPSACDSRTIEEAQTYSELRVNPFARDLASDSMDGCLRLGIEIGNTPVGEVIRGNVTIVSECNFPVAILTAPVETRLRLTPSHSFPYEGGSGSAYARVYISREPASLGFDALGDGGARVRGLPDYWIVPPNATVHESFIYDPDKLGLLPAGRYSVWIDTVGVRSDAQRSTHPGFDLSRTVKEHNRLNAEEPYTLLGSAVQNARCVASYFAVTTEDDDGHSP